MFLLVLSKTEPIKYSISHACKLKNNVYFKNYSEINKTCTMTIINALRNKNMRQKGYPPYCITYKYKQFLLSKEYRHKIISGVLIWVKRSRRKTVSNRPSGLSKDFFTRFTTMDKGPNIDSFLCRYVIHNNITENKLAVVITITLF